MIANKKTVFTSGPFTVVRVKSWGFNCNSLYTSWEVLKDGKHVGDTLRLKDAKRYIADGLYNHITGA